MLLVVWVCAVVPPVWVMAVGVGVSGFWWCCFQWWVAVVWVSRRVPGVCGCVSWLVLWACSGVCSCVPGVGGLVWFRMLTCLASFFFLVFVSCSCLLFG